jgi:pimeloyl-ACP methyl ester carboxylesterase
LRRLILALGSIVLACVVLPWAWFAVFPTTQPDLPTAGRMIEVSPGVSVNALDSGSGRTIVLVHGQPGSAYEWQPMIERLTLRGFRVIAYDRIGYGRSDGRLDDEFTVEANARELAALLDAENLYDVTLVGWSYGGGTSILAARLEPERIGRLILVGSVGPGIEGRPGPPAWIMHGVIRPALRWAMQVPPVGRRVREAFIGVAFAPGTAPEDLSLVHANFARPHSVDTMLSEGRDLDGTAEIDPSSLDVPILIIQGDGDALVPVEIAHELHRLAQNSELWIIEDGSHALPVTHPSELASRIDTFVASGTR